MGPAPFSHPGVLEETEEFVGCEATVDHIEWSWVNMETRERVEMYN